MLSESYNLDLPVTYVMAALLKDSIQHIANDPQNRRYQAYYSTPYPPLFHYKSGAGGYVPASILGRYANSSYGSTLTGHITASSIANLSEDVFPENIRRLGVEFLADVQVFSGNDRNWYASRQIKPTGPSQAIPPLTRTGRNNLLAIIRKYGLEGIAQTTGLIEFTR